MIQADRANYRNQKDQLDKIFFKNIKLKEEINELIIEAIQLELNSTNQASQEVALKLLSALKIESNKRKDFENAMHKNLSQVCNILKQNFDGQIKDSQMRINAQNEYDRNS